MTEAQIFVSGITVGILTSTLVLFLFRYFGHACGGW